MLVSSFPSLSMCVPQRRYRCASTVGLPAGKERTKRALLTARGHTAPAGVQRAQPLSSVDLLQLVYALYSAEPSGRMEAVGPTWTQCCSTQMKHNERYCVSPSVSLALPAIAASGAVAATGGRKAARLTLW